MTSMTRSRHLLLLAISCLATASAAHELIVPSLTSYWVACGWNTLAWKGSPGDPDRITLMLTNSDAELLNGAYDLGDAVASNSSKTTGNNVYMVYVPCLSTSNKYSIQFLNASGDSHTATNAFYASPLFSIQAAGTAPHPASGQSTIPSVAQAPLNQPASIIIPESVQPAKDVNDDTLPSWPPFDKNASVYLHNQNDSTSSQLTIAYLQTISLLAFMTTLAVLFL